MPLLPRKRDDLAELSRQVGASGLSAVSADENVRLYLRDQLSGYVLEQVDATAGPRPLRWLRGLGTNWREITLVLAGLLALAGLVRALGRPERQVVAMRDLAPFHIIAPEDVREDTTQADFGTFATTPEVVGRVPLRVIIAGEPLRRDQLSRVAAPRPEELEGRRIVSIPVPAHSAALAVPRTRVELLLTPKADEGAGTVLRDVIVLDARGAGDSASVVVALRGEDVGTLARLLGSSQIHVIQPVVSPPTPDADARS